MTECPLEHHAGFPWPKEGSTKDFVFRHAQLSVRGKQVLDRLLVLLSSHLKPQPTTRVSSFPPALLFSICNAFQLDRDDGFGEQEDTSILPLVLSKLRDWRLLDADYRHSPRAIHKLALDLAVITDEASSSDLNRISHTRLRVKWVASGSPDESQDRELSSSTPSLPSLSRSGVLDLTQECAHPLPDLNKRRSDVGYPSCQASRLGTPDSEDSSAVVSPRYHSVSGFRSGCSACRHLRLSGSVSTPSSPRTAPVPLHDVNQFGMSINPSAVSPRHPKSSAQHATPRKTRREKHKSSQSTSRGVPVDENKPPLPNLPIGVQRGIGISFPRQRTHSSRISNAFSPREPFSPVAASVQRRLEPSHLVHRVRQGDKHDFSHRVAFVDLRLPMGTSRPNPASPNDLRSQTRAQSFSYTPVMSHGVGSVGAGVSKLSSNAVGSQSSKRLPSWSQTHPTPTLTSVSVKPTHLSSPPANARLANPHPHPAPFGTGSRSPCPSIPGSVLSDTKHRDRRSATSQTHKHTSSFGVLLPLSPASPSPLLRVQKW